MSETSSESKALETVFEKFSELVISQNEATSRMIIEQNANTREALNDMTQSINKLAEVQTVLTNAHIEAKKDREYDQKRIERVEENQKEQGKIIGELSNTVILLVERTGVASKHWGKIAAVLSTLGTALLIWFFTGKVG